MVRELMNPRGMVANEDTPLAPRAKRDGKLVIGLFSNQKTNADLFLDNIQEGLSLLLRFAPDMDCDGGLKLPGHEDCSCE